MKTIRIRFKSIKEIDEMNNEEKTEYQKELKEILSDITYEIKYVEIMRD